MALWLKVGICVVGIEVFGSLGGLLTVSSIESWYSQLERPPGNPPNWLFGPVWTALYAMMGVALALVWHGRQAAAARRSGLIAFGSQFLLNLLWTPIFFGAHQIGWALGVIIALWIAIAVTIGYFRQVDRRAALLMIPYLCWVGYATYLNAGYLILNT